MKRMKDEWVAWGKWPGLAIVVVGLCIALVPTMLAAPVDQPSFTAWEQNVATRAALVFGDAPHIMIHDHLGSIERLGQVSRGELRAAHDGGMRMHILFKHKKDYVGGDASVSLPPIDGRIQWVNPDRVKDATAFLDDLGFDGLFYLAPGVWRDSGMSGMAIVDEIIRQCVEFGWTGVYLDGAKFGHNIHETTAAFRRLHGRGIITVVHGSIMPNIETQGWIYGSGTISGGRVDYPLEFLKYVNVLVWGETNWDGFRGDEEEAIAMLRRMSHLEDYPELRVVYLPAKNTVFDAKPERGPILVNLLYIEWAYPFKFDYFKDDYLPAWKAEREKYRADRDAYVRAKAREW